MTVTERSAPQRCRGHRHAGDRDRRPHQGVPGRHPGRRPPRPRRRARRDLRPARPERRRQDDHRRHAHHPGRSRPRARPSSAASTSSRHPAEAKQLIGVVPQTNTLDRSLTVWENLYFHGRFFGMDGQARPRPRPTALLEQFRLAERADAPVMALSGGMAQRLMVARAVMHRPSVLFLDEPTAGLDPQSRIALWEILGELHVDGQTILLTTHYMEEADQLCDRVAIIDQGRIARPRHAGRPQALGRRRHHRHASSPTATSTRSADAAARRASPAPPTPRVVDGAVAARRAGRRGRAAARSCRSPSATASRVTDLSVTETDARDRLHQPHREGPPRMTATTAPADQRRRHRPPAAPSRVVGVRARCCCATSPCCARTSRSSSRARSCSRCCWCSCSPTCSRRSARASAAAARRRRRSPACSSPAWSASAILFQGIQAVALPLVQEFGYTKRDRGPRARPAAGRAGRRSRRSSPARCSAWSPALIVFPIAAVVPATAGAPRHQLADRCSRSSRSACIMSGALGLMFGTMFDPRHGADAVRRGRASRSRSSAAPTTRGRRSSAIRWLQIAVLVNPLVYMSEGFRAALTPVPHMSLFAVYGVLIGFTVLFTYVGLRGFAKRVID